MNFRSRIAVLNAFLVVLSISLPLLASEYAFRLIRILSGKPPYYRSDPVLGWAPSHNTHIEGMPVVSSDGKKYQISFSTDEYGLRFSSSDWQVEPSGSALSLRTLVLGDSFTGDAYTSDKDAWFAYLNRDLSLPVYAYGIGGSGTFQQYLALKELLPLVKPKVVILQACSNDHVNNDPTLIFSSYTRNQELRRPYLTDKGGQFYAGGAYASIYRFLFKSSQLFAYIDNQLAKKRIGLPFIHAPTLAQSASTLRAYGGTPENLTQESLRLFVGEARAYDPSIKIFGVLCTVEQSAWWEKSFASLGITYIPQPAEAVERAEQEGLLVRTNDLAHWNILGNKIFGEELVFRLRSLL